MTPGEVLYYRVRGAVRNTTHVALEEKGRTLCGRYLRNQRETGAGSRAYARDLLGVECYTCRKALSFRGRILTELDQLRPE